MTGKLYLVAFTVELTGIGAHGY